MQRAALLLAVSSLGLLARHAGGDEGAARWVAATPDEMIALSQRAAQRGGPDALARSLVIAALADQATPGVAQAALRTIAAGNAEVAAEARWLWRSLEPAPSTPWTGMDALPYQEAASPWPGLARQWMIVGPFEDSGGGLSRAEGPESEGHRFAASDYSWGVYAVRPARTLVSSVTPRGVPLDLYVEPRRETCSYLSTVVTAPASRFRMYVASSGSFRATWDGQLVLASEALHEDARVDRAGVALTTTAGDHLLTLKVCSGALDDAGLVRVRFADDSGADLALRTSSDPARLDAAAARAPARITASDAPPLSQRPAPALIAAVVATLAGADDIRSPRAPGWLDAVAGDVSTSDDQLALAGWLSDFGSNRSGWLAQAYQRARASGDDATASFAQRTLIAHRLHTGAVDLAATTAEQPPLSLSDDLHATWLEARVLASRGGEGLRYNALRTLQALAASDGGKLPLGAWDTLAELAGAQHPSLAHRARSMIAEGLPDERGPDYLAGFRMMGGVTFERMVMSELLSQRHAGALGVLGQLLLGAGRHAAAKQVFTLVTRLSPNHAAGHAGLASALRALSPTAPAGDAVIEALRRASELSPEDDRVAAELRFRSGQVSLEPQAGADAAYLVAPAVFLERAKRAPMPKTGIDARQLHWRRVVRLHADKRVSQLMHYAREIGIEPRSEGDRYERLPAERGAELLIARVHKPDGSVLAPEEQDSAGPMVRWPKLERGDVVEVAIRTWTAGPVGRRGDAPFFFTDYVGSIDSQPVLYNEVVIDNPDGSPLSFDVIGGQPDDRKVVRKDGRTVTHLIWNDPPRIPDEPLSPRVSELVPVVVGSIYRDWAAFRGWYQGAVEGFTAPDEQIKRLARELTEGKTAREDKVRALFEFVADDIRYVNFVSGEWWLPNRPQQLLARRQGDCDDKAMLLISLLSAVGIEAQEVLVQTRYTAERRVMQSSRVAVPLFDHGIIYLPDGKGGGRFLDATSPKSRMGALPAMDSDAMVLLIDDAGGIQRTPASQPADHGVDASWTLSLAADGSGSLRADELHAGDPAFQLRTHLAEEDTRAQWVEHNLVAGWFAGITMEPDVRFDGELPSGKARVQYQATSRRIARREGGDLVVTVAPPMPWTMLIAPLPTRTLPVELPPSIAPSRRRMEVRIVAPPGYRFADLPPDATADGGPFGSASVTFEKQRDGRSIRMTREVQLAQSFIPVADYPAWRRWLQRIDAIRQRSVRLVPHR